VKMKMGHKRGDGMKKTHGKAGKGHVMSEKKGLAKGARSSSRPEGPSRKIPMTGMGVDAHTMGRTTGLAMGKPMGHDKTGT
jgi:hypothetical protein